MPFLDEVEIGGVGSSPERRAEMLAFFRSWYRRFSRDHVWPVWLSGSKAYVGRPAAEQWKILHTKWDELKAALPGTFDNVEATGYWELIARSLDELRVLDARATNTRRASTRTRASREFLHGARLLSSRLIAEDQHEALAAANETEAVFTAIVVDDIHVGSIWLRKNPRAPLPFRSNVDPSYVMRHGSDSEVVTLFAGVGALIRVEESKHLYGPDDAAVRRRHYDVAKDAISDLRRMGTPARDALSATQRSTLGSASI